MQFCLKNKLLCSYVLMSLKKLLCYYVLNNTMSLEIVLMFLCLKNSYYVLASLR